jgi:glycerophosphoryl diester phosphodiesterase
MEIQWLFRRPIAHRGLHSTDPLIPENSMRAFDRAITRNYAIELDVQVTSDQHVVVFHDYNLERMCGEDKEVADLTRADLDYYRLGKTDRIPLLSEVLQLVNGAVPLLIEIKRQPKVRHANLIILNQLLNYKGEMAIMCFDPYVLKWFAKHAGYLVRGQLASNFKGEKLNPLSKFVLRRFWLNRLSKPAFLAYDVRDLPNDRVARKRRKLPVLGWTVESPDRHQKVRPHCDNIIFEGFCP